MLQLVYLVDIDNTICLTKNGDYANSHPLEDRIAKINKLYNDGHTIIYFTARGMGRTSNNVQQATDLFYELTEVQLKKWGAKYNKLLFGKPSCDIILDDKCIDLEGFFCEQ